MVRVASVVWRITRKEMYLYMNRTINRLKIFSRITLAALPLWAATRSTFGNIIGSDTLNSDGSVTYSYVIDNSTGSFDIAAFSLEFGFSNADWNQFDVFSGGKVEVANANWFAGAGTPVVGQSAQDFLALAASADVPAGQTLTGFSFTSRFLPGIITYDEFSANGASTTGTTVGPAQAVPEGGGGLEAIALGAIITFAAGTRASRRP